MPPTMASDRASAKYTVSNEEDLSGRLEELTRGLGCPLVVGDALMQAARAQADDSAAALLEDFRDRGVQTIRGRDQGVSVWSLASSAD